MNGSYPDFISKATARKMTATGNMGHVLSGGIMLRMAKTRARTTRIKNGVMALNRT